MPKLRKMCGNCFAYTTEKICPVCGYAGKKQYGKSLFLPRGTKLNGSFILGGAIGSGGFGITYIAYDLKNEKTVAVKEYFPKTIAERKADGSVRSVGTGSEDVFAEGVEKFYREAEYVFQFNGNPNIVSVLDYFYANNTAYLTMEYLSGITLENYVKSYGVLSEAQTVYLAERLSMALVILHSAQLLHRDISPDNVMLCGDGRVKLIDFGAARTFTAKNLPQFTVVMKTGFTPIEQYTASGDFGEWTDIYSVGAVLYYALTGTIPPDPYQRITGNENLDFGEKSLDGNFTRVIEKAAGVSSAERYASASELKNDLAALKIRGEEIKIPDGYNPFAHTVHDTADENLRKRKRVRSVLFSAAEAAALALAFVLGMHADPGGETAPPSERVVTNEPVTVEFDGQPKEKYAFDGRIPSSVLKNFDGDVEITYHFAAQADSWPIGLIPADSAGNYVIKYITGDYIVAQEHGWVGVGREDESFSFTLSREGIESLGDRDIGIYTYNLTPSSAEIKAGSRKEPVSYCNYTDINYLEPLISEENGKKTVFVDFTDTDETAKRYPTEWDGYITWGIPKFAFAEFSGDILVTFEIEHIKTEDNFAGFYIYDCGMNPRPTYKSIVLAGEKDKFGNYLLSRRYDGVSVSRGVTECSIMIPRESAENILGGINFGEDHLRIKSVRLEDAGKGDGNGDTSD